MKLSILSPLVLLAAGFASPVAAQQAKPIELVSNVQLVKVTKVDGQEQQQLVAPTGVVPGDTLIFITSYRNASGETVTDFSVVSPIPQHTMLSAQDYGDAQVSIDGGKSFSNLSELQVSDAVTGEDRPAQPSDVTHLRWTLASVAPGAEGFVKFSAQVR